MQEAEYLRAHVMAWLHDWATVERKAKSQFEWAELRSDVWRVVTQLQEDQGVAFELHFYYGYTPYEITRITDWTMGSALSAIRGAIRNIYEKLSVDADPPRCEHKGSYPAGWVGGKVEWCDRS
jgi:DNA-directed RNA polymerase specialized sigma24 family protein